MADGIKIEIFKQKNADEFTLSLADPASKLETGSASAMTAALAAALLERAAALTAEHEQENERVAYILRNAGIVRKYMVNLIDEDVRSRAPLKRAMKEGGAYEIEAARQPAVAIPGEIINMMSQTLALCDELAKLCPAAAMHYLAACAELALGAVKSARHFILDMASYSTDETYRFVVRRENEITLESCEQLASAVIAAAEAAE